MRALCGAIITAGALIGLGLTAIGYGTRYGGTVGEDPNAITHLQFRQVDNPLVFILFFLTVVALVGLALAFIGLAYHHHRRHHEFLKMHGGSLGTHTETPAHTPTV